MRSLTTKAELLATTDDDPYVRWEVEDPPRGAWTLGTAKAVLRYRVFTRTVGLSGWAEREPAADPGARPTGSPGGGAAPLPGPLTASGRADLHALLAELLGDGGELAGPAREPGGPDGAACSSVTRSPAADRPVAVSVPYGESDVADGIPGVTVAAEGGDWAWLWTRTPPPVERGESALVVLDDTADAAEIQALIDRANPISEGSPGSGLSTLWLGRREGGDLVACGALHRTVTGAPHLTGLLVAPEARGRGLGLAVTAALTRRAIAEAGVATLGVYADNAVARRLYASLGYRTAHVWSSRALRFAGESDPAGGPPDPGVGCCDRRTGTCPG